MLLTGVNKAKFRVPVLAWSEGDFRPRAIRAQNEYVPSKGQALVGDKKVAEAELCGIFQNIDHPEESDH